MNAYYTFEAGRRRKHHEENPRDELLNLPNILTYIRILGIPLVMVCIWRGEPKDCVIAGWLYSLVTVTDYLDGYLAPYDMRRLLGDFSTPWRIN